MFLSCDDFAAQCYYEYVRRYWLSSDTEKNKRLTTSVLRFYVDGKEIREIVYAANGNPEVGREFFADCAGQMLTMVRVTEQSGARTYAATSPPSSKVAFGSDHSAVLTFSGVQVPPEAVVKSAQLELLPSLFDDQDKNEIGQGDDVNISLGVSLSPTCDAGSSNSRLWIVKRDLWEARGLLAECARFQTPCSTASPVLSVNFATQM